MRFAMSMLFLAVGTAAAQGPARFGYNPYMGGSSAPAPKWNTSNPWTGGGYYGVNPYNSWTGNYYGGGAFNPLTGNLVNPGPIYNPWAGYGAERVYRGLIR